MDEVDRELAELKADTATSAGVGEAFLAQAKALDAWIAWREEMTAQLRAQLTALLGDDRQPEIDRWWRDVLLASRLRRGRLSGERYDPYQGISVESNESLAASRERWRGEMSDLAASREQALLAVPGAAATAISSGHAGAWVRAMDDVMAWRVAMQRRAVEEIGQVATLLPEGDRSAWLRAARRAALPGVWRPDRADRALAAALEAVPLAGDQRIIVEALRRDHATLLEEVSRLRQDAALAEEGRMLLAQDQARAAMYFPDLDRTRPLTPDIDAGRAALRSLSRDTLERLRSVLDDSQWAAIPGTASRPARSD